MKYHEGKLEKEREGWLLNKGGPKVDKDGNIVPNTEERYKPDFPPGHPSRTPKSRRE